VGSDREQELARTATAAVSAPAAPAGATLGRYRLERELGAGGHARDAAAAALRRIERRPETASQGSSTQRPGIPRPAQASGHGQFPAMRARPLAHTAIPRRVDITSWRIPICRSAQSTNDNLVN
jgi:hypothetical protein